VEQEYVVGEAQYGVVRGNIRVAYVGSVAELGMRAIRSVQQQLA
jgi:carbon monoxide dehydrogenase subunit G